MITYKDRKGIIYKEHYEKNTKNIDLSYKNIVEIVSIDNLNELEVLNLSNNKITEIKNLDQLVSLQVLVIRLNGIKEIKGLDKLINLRVLGLNTNLITEIKGLDKLANLQELFLHENQISRIESLDKLINLRIIRLSANKITEIEGLDRLVNLHELWLGSNKITEIKDLGMLTGLQTLCLMSNQITEIEGLNRLTNLHEIWLSSNRIKEVKGLDELINLRTLYLHLNDIKEIPLAIMSLKRLKRLSVDCEINPIIQRFLDRNQIKDEKTIYDDKQNVHDSQIVKSIQESIYKITSYSKDKFLDKTQKEIVDDKVLDQPTKEQLIEYCQDKTVHSILNLTFDEVLCSVWKVITEHKESDEIKKILNTEMKDSLCKCFTGRLSRLINCLNGFDERVSIKISDKQEILNVIIKIRQKYEDVEKQKEEVMKELTERGYKKEMTEEYLIYLE